jgi:hypothetical protein
MPRSGINKSAIRKFTRDLQREFDRQGPIRIPVEAEPSPDVQGLRVAGSPSYGPIYNGPVIMGNVDGGA